MLVNTFQISISHNPYIGQCRSQSQALAIGPLWRPLLKEAMSTDADQFAEPTAHGRAVTVMRTELSFALGLSEAGRFRRRMRGSEDVGKGVARQSQARSTRQSAFKSSG
jgi:hypothetical protein